MIRKFLRLFALFLFLAALAFWAISGANLRWTKTSVPVKRTDEVTGITVDDYQRKFVPGIDFLGAVSFGALFLGGLSFLFRKGPSRPT